MKNERERIIGSRINGPGSYTLKALSRTGGGRKKRGRSGGTRSSRTDDSSILRYGDG